MFIVGKHKKVSINHQKNGRTSSIYVTQVFVATLFCLESERHQEYHFDTKSSRGKQIPDPANSLLV